MPKRTENSAAYESMKEQGKAFDIAAMREAFGAPTGNLYALLEYSYLATITPDVSPKTLAEELAKGTSPVYLTETDIRNWARVYEQFSYLGGATAETYRGGIYRLPAMIRVANFVRSHPEAAQNPDERCKWLRHSIELTNAELRGLTSKVKHADPKTPKNLNMSTWDTLKRVREGLKALVGVELSNDELIMGLTAPLDGDQPENIAAQYALLADLGEWEPDLGESDGEADDE